MIIQMTNPEGYRFSFMPPSTLRNVDIGKEVLLLFEKQMVTQVIFSGFLLSEDEQSIRLLFSHPDYPYYFSYSPDQLEGWQLIETL